MFRFIQNWLVGKAENLLLKTGHKYIINAPVTGVPYVGLVLTDTLPEYMCNGIAITGYNLLNSPLVFKLPDVTEAHPEQANPIHVDGINSKNITCGCKKCACQEKTYLNGLMRDQSRGNFPDSYNHESE